MTPALAVAGTPLRLRPVSRQSIRLEPACLALIALARGLGRMLRHDMTDWQSATFSGARHVVELEFIGREAVDAGEAMMLCLEEHPFNIPGLLVADAKVRAATFCPGETPLLIATVELLVLEEA